MIPTADTLAAAAAPVVRSLAAADSAGRAAGADTLTTAGASLADTLATGALSADTLPTHTLPAAADLFGPRSEAVWQAAAAAPSAAPLSGEPLYQLLLLLFAAAYGLLVYTYASDVRLLLRALGLDRNAAKHITENNGALYTHFLHLCLTVGIAFTALLAVRLADDLLPAAFAPLPFTLRQLLPPIGAATVAAAMLAQWILLRTIGHITLERGFIGTLLHLRLVYAALLALVAAPPAMLYVLCPAGTGRGWLGAALLVSGWIMLLYFRQLRWLFVEKNISKLQCILYLCIVEIAPYLTAALFLIKYSVHP